MLVETVVNASRCDFVSLFWFVLSFRNVRSWKTGRFCLVTYSWSCILHVGFAATLLILLPASISKTSGLRPEVSLLYREGKQGEARSLVGILFIISGLVPDAWTLALSPSFPLS
jgi:hypothetical protein